MIVAVENVVLSTMVVPYTTSMGENSTSGLTVKSTSKPCSRRKGVPSGSAPTAVTVKW